MKITVITIIVYHTAPPGTYIVIKTTVCRIMTSSSELTYNKCTNAAQPLASQPTP